MKNCFRILKSGHLLFAFFCAFVFKGYCQKETQTSDSSAAQLVKIGNHKLFISIKGSSDAKFTVVFESGAGGSSQDWTQVISLLPPEIRTVAYDRAGVGKSEKGPLPQTMAQNVFELHELLQKAEIKGSIILVGQSLGGLIVRLYTEQYGKDIAGLVLVDPTHESSVLGSMKYGGWVRLREKAVGKSIPKPQVRNSISPGYDSTADYMAEEFQNMYLSSIKNPQELGSRPLIILGAGIRQQPPGTPDEQWKELRNERDKQIQDLTILSNNSKFILDPKSSHAIQNDNPEIIAKSIQMVINSITSKTKL
ncbi:alpha/beta hydrolase [Ilyomonas limi]|uniref:Alpha/beta hydrolase n=1 Tax=Ilyomonas limi TaxID=2575867 RepID=A0A4U3KSB3_9BACT|nr:alpha/beta hydrolase [Ilyomonas limi]TKK65248.1 alpha/beta hydrolase [Ilyomonas limi]